MMCLLVFANLDHLLHEHGVCLTFDHGYEHKAPASCERDTCVDADLSFVP